MSNRDNNNNNNGTSSGTFDYIMNELIENDKKRKREEEDSDDNGEPEFKRQKVGYTYDSDYVPSGSSSEFSDSDAVSDSVSDDGEESEVARINTKYSKRFDAIEDYKEKNELLSENIIQDVMNKVDSGGTLSKQEYDTLDRADRLMDRDVYNDKSLAEDIILYENSCNITQKEINDNMDRISHHERKLASYRSRLIELEQENSKMSSNNDSSNSDNNSNNNPYSNNNPDSNSNPDSNNSSNSLGSSDDYNKYDSNNCDSNNSSNSPGQNNSDDGHDDGFDDFPPSFDFDDF
jgi:hypothetical protein